MIPAVVGIPIKPFGVAKQRLAAALDAKQRSVLGRAIAARTASTIAESGAKPVVVTNDDGVSRWAKSLHLDVIPEGIRGASGLDRAATAVAAAAHGESWAVVHADLPVASAEDFGAAWGRLDESVAVIAPSYDGGTNLIAAADEVRFAYGAASFTRHLRLMPNAAVVTRIGLAYDLDTPRDLAFMRTLEVGRWLRSLLEVVEASPAAS